MTTITIIFKDGETMRQIPYDKVTSTDIELKLQWHDTELNVDNMRVIPKCNIKYYTLYNSED